MSDRRFDLVVYGASSFVGEILCRYLAERIGFDGEVRWAIAGRSGGKLEALRYSLGERAKGLEIIIADADDEAALTAMCESTRVVVTTVGPYALYGETLVRCCVNSGTDYCDITGEVQWIRRMIDAYGSKASQTGARIVHCCGFDSIPSDLGVHFLQGQSTEDGNAVCNQIRMRVKGIRGGFSGGTVASLVNVVKEALADQELRRSLKDPFFLCPSRPDSAPRQPDTTGPRYDKTTRGWIAPFVMAGINTKIVHRSNALKNYSWGREFRYDEALSTGSGSRGRATAYSISFVMGAFMLAISVPAIRGLLERFVLPKPGQGPSPKDQERGWFDIRFHGTRPDGSRISVKVTGDRDPGYGSTAKMLGESALCLVEDVSRDEVGGGFWTPSTAMGDKLIRRLTNHAGLTFSETKVPR